MASATVELLIDRIVSALKNETSLLRGVSDEVDEIRQELISMRSFLEDADRKGASSEGEKTWVTNVRDMAHNIEDVIDEFMYHMNSIQAGRGRFARFLHHTIHIPKSLWWRHQTATKLVNINRKIKTISERNQRYGVNRIEGKSSQDNLKWQQFCSESSHYLEEDNLVGIEDRRKPIMGLLMDEEPLQTVISIVGMGGSGKTTLVANTYNNEAIKRHFDCHAWISVSQTYVIEDLFRRLIKELYEARKESVPSDLGSMDYKMLLHTLVTYLELKRYLVVFDDVWDKNLWRQIKISLPETRLGSRIIFTTRKEDVADFPSDVRSFPYHIQPLEWEEAWQLFSKKAFSGNPNKSCPQELETVAQELVKKCEGLPLAIDALGGLMSSKGNSEWIEVSKNLNWHLNNEDDLHIVKSILLISFDDLSYRLKHCFLYCSLFPEDYLIRKNKLSRMWIAQGFVEQDQDSTPEVVAERYLKQLIFRSMLQVVPMYKLSEKSKLCKMHDLMRELALSISKREKFCAVYGGQGAVEECKARHLSIHTAGENFESCTGMSQLQSFLVFDDSFTTLPPGFKMLRVLDLKYATIYKLPKGLMKLFNLRYLNLRGTSIEELPESIGRLYSLQTLDIRDTKIKALPCGIVKLQNLRHLIIYHRRNATPFRYVDGTQAPFRIDRLKNLQVLSSVEAEGDLIRRIRSMTQLTRIGITNVKATEENDLCVSIQNMKLLHYLFVMLRDEEESVRMDALLYPPPCLQTLILVGKLVKVPRWFGSLHMVIRLSLSWSRLEEDPLPHIASLPNLKKLYFGNAYVGPCLCFNRGFTMLTELQISMFPQLNEIIIEKGVMQKLELLWLFECMELKTVPTGIEHLKNLKELGLTSVSSELVNRIRGEEPVVYEKVQHIPEIWMF